MFVTIRPPVVIPGVAEVEVRGETTGLAAVRVVPVPLNKGESKFTPVPDALKRSETDQKFFTGSLWIMAAGSWQVRLTADGEKGQGSLAVPVPSVALSTKKMQVGMAAGLLVLMILLVAGLVLMMGASVREAKLEPGGAPPPALVRRARISMAITFVVIAVVLSLGWQWWSASEDEYRRNIFSPTRMRASLDGTGQLLLKLAEPESQARSAAPSLRPAFFARSVDDLVPDHDHLMHLYAIREPDLDIVYHLHPQPEGAGTFRLTLPDMDAGRYWLYADIVHANGFPETLVTDLEVPTGIPSRPLASDDARGAAASWKAASLEADTFALPDGYRMVWKRPTQELHSKEPYTFEFTLVDREGKPASDMALYMGMPGHAAFVKTDGSAFAHIHPSGTVSMASFTMAQEQLSRANPMAADMSLMDHSGHANAPNVVSFPYGFPSAGRYRIVVQMKHSGTVETGIFDTIVR